MGLVVEVAANRSVDHIFVLIVLGQMHHQASTVETITSAIISTTRQPSSFQKIPSLYKTVLLCVAIDYMLTCQYSAIAKTEYGVKIKK